MRPPHIQNLIVFCLVAKHKSTKLVADILHVDTTTITRNVKNLEDTLQLTLVKRAKHFIGLTKEGEILYNKYRHSIAYYEDLLLSSEDIYKEYVNNREIKILLPMLGSEELLNLSLFDSLKDVFQEHTLSIGGVTSGEIAHFPHVAIQKIVDADIMFIPEKLVPELPDEYNTIYHYKEYIYLCGSPDYIEKHDINERNYKQHIQCKVDEPLEKGNFHFINRLNTKIKVDNSQKLSNLLLQNYGIAPISVAPVKKIFAAGQLNIVLPQIVGEKSWYLARKVYKSQALNKKLAEASEIMKSWIINYIDELESIIHAQTNS